MSEDERKLYVGNLPGDIAEDEIHEVFSLYGNIDEVHINVPKDGRNARSAFVRFEESQDAAAAMAVLGDMYKFREMNTPIRVNVARPAFGAAGGKGFGKFVNGGGYGETGYGAAADANALAPGVAAPPAVATPPPPAAISARGGPLTNPPPAAPVSSWSSGAPPSGGGHWGDGYGRAQANGRPDAARHWGPGAYPSDGGRDPVSGRDLSAKLWVGNLPGDISPESIKEIFSKYGHVEDVSILPNKSRSGQLCAFVHYALPSQAEACLQAMSAGYELRPGEGELKVERHGGRGKGYGGGYGGKGKRGYQPY